MARRPAPAPAMGRARRALLLAMCSATAWWPTATHAIKPEDVPTFRMSCRATNSFDGSSATAPPPPLPPFPAPPCTLNATASTACTASRGVCKGATCIPSNYSFSVGCDWFVPCEGLAGVETFSGGSDWSAWSAEYNLSMANHSITTQKCYPHCFYESYPTLGIELGVRSYRKDLGVLNVTCALTFTGRDAGKSTQIQGSLHNSDDTSANPASFTGWIGLMLGRENASQPSPGPQVRTYRDFNEVTPLSLSLHIRQQLELPRVGPLGGQRLTPLILDETGHVLVSDRRHPDPETHRQGTVLLPSSQP